MAIKTPSKPSPAAAPAAVLPPPAAAVAPGEEAREVLE
jgi:hypothetical protein